MEPMTLTGPLCQSSLVGIPYKLTPNASTLSEVPGQKKPRTTPPKLGSRALSIRPLEGSRWGGGAGALMLWVLNVCEGVEVGVAGLLGSGESGRAAW
jgi:hypothetical protein